MLDSVTSSFLQQAAHITNGVYLSASPINQNERLIHYLVHSLLPEPAVRKEMLVSSHDTVDFRPGIRDIYCKTLSSVFLSSKRRIDRVCV